MSVRFYNGRRRVYTVSATSFQLALELMESTGIVWTRYKIYRLPLPHHFASVGRTTAGLSIKCMEVQR